MSRTRAQQETSAGGVVYRLDGERPLFLLIRDSYQNWGFPKGHLEEGENAEEAALREVREETGITELAIRGKIETIDWYFRFRGRLIHKVCHFYLMQTSQSTTAPQSAEGITACQWCDYDAATSSISYANARSVLRRAQEMVSGVALPLAEDTNRARRASRTEPQIARADSQLQLGLGLGEESA